MQALSVTKNTTYLTLSYIGQKILSFVYFIMIARVIGVEDLGKYTFALSFTTMFAVFVDLGLTSALIRELAKFQDRAEKYLSTALVMKIILSFIVYSIVVVAINLMGYPAITKQLVYVSGLIMALDQFAGGFWGMFRGQRNLKLESVSMVIQETIVVVAGAIVLYLRLPLIFLMMPLVLSSLFGFIFSSVSVRSLLKIKYRLIWDSEIVRFLLKISIPFALVAIFSRIYTNLDTVMLSKLAGDKAVGWYSVAMKIPFALQFLPAALSAAVFPAFSHAFHYDKEQLRKTFGRVMKFLTVLVLPISAGIIALAQPFVKLAFGASYLPAAIPLQIAMLGLTFLFLNYPLGALLNGCNKQTTNAKLVGATLIINVVCNAILIPRYSFVGASIAFIISHGFLFVSSLFVANKIVNYDKRELFVSFAKTLFSALVMGGALYFLVGKLNLFALIGVGIIIYAVVMLWVKCLTMEDVKLFYQDFILKNREQ